MLNLIYWATTYNKLKQKVEVKIYKEGFSGTAQEMTLAGDTPISIEYDCDNNIFKPLIQSKCIVNIVTKEPYLDLYTGKLNEIICTVSLDDTVQWFGYLTPNIYNSDYDIGYNELSLEFIDIIAQLDNVNFSRFNYYSTFLQIIQRGIKSIDNLNIIRYINDQITSDKLYINAIGCLERNYIDETGDDKDGTMTYKEVFESILQYLGKSIIYMDNQLFIVDMTSQVSKYRQYDIANNSLKTIDYHRQLVGLDNSTDYLGVANSSCTISLGDVYNKITLIANNNPVENIIPDLFDESKFKPLMPDNEKYIQMTIDDVINGWNTRAAWVEKPEEKNKTVILNAFFSAEGWNVGPSYITVKATARTGEKTEYLYDDYVSFSTYIPENPSDTGLDIRYKLIDANGNEILTNYKFSFGESIAFFPWVRRGNDGYLYVNADYSDLGHTNYIGGQTIETKIQTGTGMVHDFRPWNDVHWVNPNPGLMSINNINHVCGGIFIQKYADWKITDGTPASIKWNTCLTIQKLPDLIGSGYTPLFNENEVPHLDLLDKYHFVGMGGYFIISMEYMFSNIFNHANTAPFRFTNETYGHVLKYSRTPTDGIVWTEDGVPQEKQGAFRDDKFMCMLKIGSLYFNGEQWVTTKSYFTLRHKNKDGDKIFGQTKKIDNTVSFTWHLADSSEGYAIPLPAGQVLYGDIEFKLFADSRIGGSAQYPKLGLIGEYGDADEFHKYDGSAVSNSSPICAINITQLKLVYTNSDSTEDIYNLQQYDADVLYTNIIDDEFVTKMDDIELTTNTYTPHAGSFSYVLKQNNDGSLEYVVETQNGKNQETNIVEKYVNYYSQPKLIYSNNLNAFYYKKNNASNKYLFSPLCLMKLNSRNKPMAPIMLKYDLHTCTMDATFIEIQ